jgi:hypothetical protein
MQDALLLLPTETTYCGTHQNSIGIGQVQASYQTIPTHWREGGKEGAKVRVCFTARDTFRRLAAG